MSPIHILKRIGELVASHKLFKKVHVISNGRSFIWVAVSVVTTLTARVCCNPCSWGLFCMSAKSWQKVVSDPTLEILGNWCFVTFSRSATFQVLILLNSGAGALALSTSGGKKISTLTLKVAIPYQT